MCSASAHTSCTDPKDCLAHYVSVLTESKRQRDKEKTARERLHMAMFRRSLSNEARGGGRGGAAGEETRGERRIGLRFCVFSLTKSQGDDQTGGVKGYPPFLLPDAAYHTAVCVCVCVIKEETERARREKEEEEWFLHDSLFHSNQPLNTI